MPSIFFSKTSHLAYIRCDVFEKKIDVGSGNLLPPIEIGGFKACPDSSSGMIDVLIAQVGFNRRIR
jgi:hypothetical protein